MGKIHALCVSEKKGTLKHPVPVVQFETEWGIRGDAHAGCWHRQVSFLGLKEIEDFRKLGVDVKLGSFGENVVADGFRFKELPVGTRLRAGDAREVADQLRDGRERRGAGAVRRRTPAHRKDQRYRQTCHLHHISHTGRSGFASLRRRRQCRMQGQEPCGLRSDVIHLHGKGSWKTESHS